MQLSITLLSSVCVPREYNHGMPQLMHIQFERALAAASNNYSWGSNLHGYMLGVHMNERTLLNMS